MVGLYTGNDNRGQQVEQVKVWLAVVHNLPMVFPSGQPEAPSTVVVKGNRTSWCCFSTLTQVWRSRGPYQDAGLPNNGHSVWL